MGENKEISQDCLICAQGFCQKHTPKFGDVIRVWGLSVYVGSIPFFTVLFDRFVLGLKPVKYWMGTDVLTMFMYPPHKRKWKVWLHRAKMWLLNWVLYQHWFVSANLLNETLQLRWFKVRCEWLIFKKPPPKLKPEHRVKHEGFNVLVYNPKRSLFDKWLYGDDIIRWLQNEFLQVNWIEVDGSKDMSEIYPIVDAYIRPTRHDGDPLMVQECELWKIPVWWSSDGKPEYHDIENWLRNLLVYSRNQKK